MSGQDVANVFELQRSGAAISAYEEGNIPNRLTIGGGQVKQFSLQFNGNNTALKNNYSYEVGNFTGAGDDPIDADRTPLINEVTAYADRV